ncbi:DUF1801 domain-containing protein [Corallococcus aberystwythensis]|uniref:DUF1801 domain-containing protein n=2 Tax=Corallococcus aberystwythensis TaxID=2316722 RepID=A0A3A8PLY0_9BACT|nr:DUF1801 domain-containing protein [Corallococcus aberystwythensis]
MRRALPTAEEAIKYGMPAYLVGGRAVASFAGFKNHYALYIVSATLFDAIARDLPNREMSKGIIRFDFDEPVPEAVVQRLANWSQTEGSATVAMKGPKRAKKPVTPRPKQRKPESRKTKRGS